MSELFAGFDSPGEVEPTATVLLMVPLWVGLTTMVIVTLSPLVMFPIEHTTWCNRRMQVPLVVVTERNPALLGS